MQSKVRFIGLDVHKDSIMIALAEQQGEPQVLKQIPNEPGRVLKELRKLGKGCELKVCYEAGPLGFGLQRELTQKKIDCIIVAPSLIPIRSGERIKTDRRDACKLAHFLRSGDLTPIWIPDEETEAIRDLERSREDARLAERTARRGGLDGVVLWRGGLDGVVLCHVLCEPCSYPHFQTRFVKMSAHTFHVLPPSNLTRIRNSIFRKKIE